MCLFLLQNQQNLNTFALCRDPPPGGQVGELYVLWTCDLLCLCHCSIQCLYALWVTNSPAEMCFSVATLLLAATESKVFWNWR